MDTPKVAHKNQPDTSSSFLIRMDLIKRAGDLALGGIGWWTPFDKNEPAIDDLLKKMTPKERVALLLGTKDTRPVLKDEMGLLKDPGARELFNALRSKNIGRAEKLATLENVMTLTDKEEFLERLTTYPAGDVVDFLSTKSARRVRETAHYYFKVILSKERALEILTLMSPEDRIRLLNDIKLKGSERFVSVTLTKAKIKPTPENVYDAIPEYKR
jgi:hypothetical protein